MDSTQDVPYSFAAASVAQQLHGVTVAHGSFTQAGGNLSIQNHYHSHSGPSVTIADVLRLVPNLRKVHLDILSKATTGTAIWVLRTKKFILWLDPNCNIKILWGTGIPGAGKTVMASIVIDNLEARAAASASYICVAYIYFRYNEATDLTIRSILEILVKQTVERLQVCAWIAEEAYARHLSERTQPTEFELLQLLRRFTEATSATFYILDALDEAPERLQVDLIKKLSSLKARLFITSRPLNVVEARFPDAHSFAITAQESDLDVHITQEISRSRELQDLLDDADPSFRHEVVSLIKKNSGGMFLHASLQLDAICRCTTTQDVIDTLEQFPPNIQDVYHQTWIRICNQSPQNIRLAKAVLMRVLNAARSMKLEELRHAIATCPTTHKFERKRLASASTLVTLCCGLIAVEEETQFVRLVHYTAKDTLRELLHDTFPRPHSLLATICLTHLSDRGFQNTTHGQNEYMAALHSDPLLAYASDAWATHVGKSLDIFEVKQQVAGFVSNIRAFPCLLQPGHSQSFDIIGPLHILALYSLPLSLIPPDVIGDPNSRTIVKKTSALLLASWLGNMSMVQDLLGLTGIQVNLSDRNRCSALLLAARLGHQGVVELLLTHPEIDVNLIDQEGWSPLMKAANEGHENIVGLLLSRPEIEVNLVDNAGWSALMNAAHRGYAAIVILLLSNPEIQVNMVNEDGESVLMKAAQGGHTTIVGYLLARQDVQINAVDRDGWSALTYAAFKGHRGTVQILLSRPEIEVNSMSKMGWSPLMVAAMQGHESTVTLLLDHGEVQVNLVDIEGCSALMRAAGRGHEGTTALLLARPEIKVNIADNGGRTAFMHTARGGYEGVASLLLAHPEIQVNVVDDEGWSELMFASLKGHEGLVTLLLARPEAQVNAVDNRGWSALMNAARFGYEGVVRHLLAHHGIRVNLTGRKNRSALMVAAQHGHAGVVQLLLARPEIQVNLIDDDGHTALVKAAREGHEDVVAALLAHPDSQDTPDDLLLEVGETMLEVGWIVEDEEEVVSDAYSSGDSELYYDADEGLG